MRHDARHEQLWSNSSRFGNTSSPKLGHARDVAARPAKAGDKTEFNWICGHLKNDRDGRRRRLRRKRRRRAGRDNHAHLTTNQIGGQRRQAIVVILGETVFDRYVLAIDVARFLQPLPERRHAKGVRTRPNRAPDTQPPALPPAAARARRAAQQRHRPPPRVVRNVRLPMLEITTPPPRRSPSLHTLN